MIMITGFEGVLICWRRTTRPKKWQYRRSSAMGTEPDYRNRSFSFGAVTGDAGGLVL
jgi:hypothetical protein